MNITGLTEEYVRTRPSLKDCLAIGLVNYSAVSRQIIRDLGLGKNVHVDAVLVALRRYKRKIQTNESQEKRIISILKQSSLEMKNKIVVAIIDKRLYYDYVLQLSKKVKKEAKHIHIIEGSTVVTIVTDETFLSDIKKLFGNEIIDIQKDLVQITLRSPQEIESTPGVFAFLVSLFAQYGVNIIECMSCWTDTMFVIDEKDVGKVMDFLNF
jgi:aspartokinase